MKSFFLLFLFFLKLTVLSAQNNIDDFLKTEELQKASVGFVIYNLKTKSEVASYNVQKQLYPASLQKIITTQAALAVLGEDFRYKTKINLKGKQNGNKFTGVLEIVGSGDPSLSNRFVDFVYDFLKENNIQAFEGYIVVDESIFDALPPQSWLLEDLANYYASPAFAFNFLENTYKLRFQQTSTGTQPQIVNTIPKMTHLLFENQLRSEGTKDNAYILGVPFSKERKIVGSIPPGKGMFGIKGAIDNPAQIFKNEFLKKIKSEQIQFRFKASVDTTNILKSKMHISQKMSDIVKVTNQNSNNLYAEALLKRIGYEKYGFGSVANGLKAIASLYQIDKSLIFDASGLSRKNRMSPIDLLALLLQNEKNITFRKSLGLSGVSGTMKYFSSEKTKAKIQAKSGSADAVLNYAGYFKNDKGEDLAFVLMVNNYSGSKTSVRKAMLKLLEAYL